MNSDHPSTDNSDVWISAGTPLHSSDERWRIATVLVPTDLSDSSLQALQFAAAVSARFGAEVILLHADRRRGPDTMLDSKGVLSEERHNAVECFCKESRERVKQDLARLAKECLLHPTKSRLFVREGDLVEMITDVANETDADLVVISTHARRGLQRLLYGSVAEQVLRRARCPVLVVPRVRNNLS